MTTTEVNPNIVFIVSDAARARNFSLYGYDRDTTPFLEEFAEQSHVYENTISTSPWTVPSHASMFTGLYTSKHGATRSNPSISNHIPTLPKIFNKKGYSTHCLTANQLLTLENGLNAGFDYTEIPTRLFPNDTDYSQIKSSFSSNGFSRTFVEDLAGFLWEEKDIKDASNLAYKFATKLLGTSIVGHRRREPKGTNSIVNSFDSIVFGSDEPFFTYINLMETHLKYIPDQGFLRQVAPPNHSTSGYSDVNQDPRLYNYANAVDMDDEDFALLQSFYDGAVRQTDQAISEIVKSLNESGVLKDTLVVIVGDHGENIGDFGRMGHSLSLNDAVLRVPLIVSYPGDTGGERISELVQTVDLFTTIDQVCNLGVSESDEVGLDSQPLPRTRDEQGRDYAVAEYLGSPFDGIQRVMEKYPEQDYSELDFEIKTIYDSSARKLTIHSDGRERMSEVDINGEIPLHGDELQDQEDLESKLFEIVEPFGTVGINSEYEDSVRDTLRDLGYI
ncbi:MULTISPECIES: sulfatase [Haloferacaceae]|uniref:Sulfatase n=1 Tax=Halorubrum glutamatedens TaxID=2707018 RepID=A0ABD5QNB3_9EURY|nr:sulfatase [Halobellus captivus]